jgi:hypothetical protein
MALVPLSTYTRICRGKNDYRSPEKAQPFLQKIQGETKSAN